MSAGLRLLEVADPGAPIGFHGMIGAHPTMLRLFEAIRRAAPLEVPVIVQGPTGSGKELVAQALHALSGRRGPVVPVNVGTARSSSPRASCSARCVARTPAPWGADGAGRIGARRDTAARRGSRAVRGDPDPAAARARVRRRAAGGGTAGRHVQFRLILCVQQSAAELVAAKRWREDFYYRVAGVSLTVPALEERPSDVALLANHWLARLGHPAGRPRRRAARRATVAGERARAPSGDRAGGVSGRHRARDDRAACRSGGIAQPAAGLRTACPRPASRWQRWSASTSSGCCGSADLRRGWPRGSWGCRSDSSTGSTARSGSPRRGPGDRSQRR